MVKRPPWPNHRPMYIDDELDLMEPVFRLTGERFHLIGHSWGGAIALKAALRHSRRLQSLILFEPALWSLLIADDPGSPASREITTNRDETQRLMDQGDFVKAGEYFINYWLGPNTWIKMSNAQQSSLVNGMHAASPEWYASFHETTQLSAFVAIDMPILLLSGKESTEPARAITKLLSSVLPHARLLDLEGIGHLGPVTHPEVVNSTIETFLIDISKD